MDREQMSNEENYHFDVTGFLHVPGVLNSGEVARLNAVLDESGASDGFLSLPEGQRDPFRDLLVHPHLVWYLNQIIAQGFKLERLPQLLGSDPQTVGQPLEGGGEPRDSGTAYFFKNGRRYCQGVHVIWALSDVNAGGGGFVLVPYTHKANVEVPEHVLTGSDDIGLTQQPAMKAGDLLIVGLSTTAGHPPLGDRSRPSSPEFRIHGTRHHSIGRHRSFHRNGATTRLARRIDRRNNAPHSILPGIRTQLRHLQPSPTGRSFVSTQLVTNFILRSTRKVPIPISTRRNSSSGICVATSFSAT